MLKELFRAGATEAMLRDKIMAIEYFPYHSKSWKDLPSVPSQQFAFDLVREAIKRGKTIVVRSPKRWIEAVPELALYPYITFKNPRIANVTPNNLGIMYFNIIKSLILGSGNPMIDYIQRFDTFDSLYAWLMAPETDVISGRSEQLRMKQEFMRSAIDILRRKVQGNTLAARDKAIESIGYRERMKIIYEELHG